MPELAALWHNKNAGRSFHMLSCFSCTYSWQHLQSVSTEEDLPR